MIWAYDFDLAAEPLPIAGSSTTAATTVILTATVDSEGFLWSARWEGACVLRIDPKGRIDRVVPMPARA